MRQLILIASCPLANNNSWRNASLASEVASYMHGKKKTAPHSSAHPSHLRFRPRCVSVTVQRLSALLGQLRYLGCLAANRNPILARYLPDGQRRDADNLSPPVDHVGILLEVCKNLFLESTVEMLS